MSDTKIPTGTVSDKFDINLVRKAWIEPAYHTLDIRETANTANICVLNDGFTFSNC